MKIAILTSGILPVPAVQGGAVENLIDFYLEYNDRHKLHDITIYSVWHPDVKKHPALKSNINHYIYIQTQSLWAKFRKKIYQYANKHNYYHHSIEYYLNETLRELKRSHYDIIIIENRPGYALKIKQITNTKIVIHLHNEKLDKQTLQAQAIYNCSDRIVTISHYITNRVQTINTNDCKCITVYNGIDLEAFNRSIKDQKKLSFQEDDFILVFSGRLNEEKGIMQLIDAIIKLKKYLNIKLLVIGSSFYANDDMENSFTKKLKNKAADLKDRIIFTGFVPYSKMPNYLKTADVAVIPSMWEEPFGQTIVEAMAIGLPIITTRSGGIPEICENVAIIVERKNIVDNLAAAILDLYKHPEKREQMAKASLERSKLFDKETYAKNFFEALEGL